MIVVSVVVAVRDGASTIGTAVRSALAQSLSEIEVIVVDDASRDATADTAREAAGGDPRLRIVSLPENLGPAGARNRGIAAARGRFVAILDADDSFAPDRLARLVARAEETGAPMAVDDLLLVAEETGAELGPMYGFARLPRMLDARAYALGDLPQPGAARRGTGFLKPLVAIDFLRANAIAYEEDMRFAEDYTFALACLIAGARCAVLDAPLYRYSIRTTSLTANHGAADLARLCRTDERALASEAARADPALAAALARHLASVRKRERWAAFIDQVKARQWRDLPRTAAYSPQIFAHIAACCLGEAARRSARRLAALPRA